MEPIIHLLTSDNGKAFLLTGGAVALSPLVGWVMMRLLSAGWFLAFLGRALNASRATGQTVTALPKLGPFRLIFGPVVYLMVFGIAICMAWVEGVLSKSDPEVQKLTNALIQALRKAGASDQLAYLERKTMGAPQIAAVDKMQEALKGGASPFVAAQAALLAHEVAEGDAMQADRLKGPG